ncbi:nitroreductase [Clostridium tetanomorphum]|uniref:Putative nitroreductase TM1586 domain-containing protein n=1 Tax=Clostridium tetanomorphum TaxID=1553 RepID=A0A923IZU4_CLOTT|nr:nitroreductase family protein [Clostridium tetanomorphum]KAJ51780.1 hypothetical protein CTM_10948 [Clostridium tetanomorphum DSM 665]MBC2397661.1 hypothetical protein [Clostridium tetanomorphum]MBP1865015.1 nitroreductase [Clostridium tetanomorphum]NRS83388.1 nitroreductase [Clostridium tetanomorphum]NRZ96587.1 nitroreductase [Clostridium tetanomorphum]
MNFIEAINKRHSVRKYINKPVEEIVFNNLDKFISNTPRLYNDIDMKIYVVRHGEKIHKISKGIIGSYGKIKAPHYLIVTSEEKEGYLENIGFVLEKIVLQLTMLNIATCWIGGFIKKELLDSIIEIPKNHKPTIVIAFGYGKEGNDIINKISKGYKRKSMGEFASGNFDGEWIDILEMIRKAPSAMNFQPWRLFKNENEIDLYIVKRNFIGKKLEVLNRIDAGIALCHLNIGGEIFNKKLDFKKLKGKEKENLNYVISAIE